MVSMVQRHRGIDDDQIKRCSASRSSSKSGDSPEWPFPLTIYSSAHRRSHAEANEVRVRYWITDIGDEEAYFKLLELCESHRQNCSLVINSGALPAQSAFDFVATASTFIVGDKQQTSWPGGGTLEPGATCRVIYVQVCPESIGLLRKAATNLYDWVHPFLPEDLAFYRPDGSVFFAAITHEGVSFFEIDSAEMDRVKSKLPTLDLLTVSPI